MTKQEDSALAGEEGLDRSKRQRKKKKLFEEHYLMTDLIFKKKRKRRTKEEMEQARQDDLAVREASGKKKRKRRRRNADGELVFKSENISSVDKEKVVVKTENLSEVQGQTEEEHNEEMSAIEKDWTYPARHFEYMFELKSDFSITQNGRRVYKCDICAGIYKHTFSLKRHYLRNHINCRYLSRTDIANCLIPIGQQQLAALKANNQEVHDKVKETLSKKITDGNVCKNIENMKAKSSPGLECDEKLDTIDEEQISKDDESDEEEGKMVIDEIAEDINLDTKPENTTAVKKKNVIKYNGIRYGLFKCSICHKLYDELETLKSHTKDHPPVADEKGFPCDKCHMQFTYRQNLVRHQLVHDQEDKSKSKGDVKKFGQVGKKSTGSRKIAPNADGTPVLKPYKCSKCPMKFKFPLNLERHEAIHFGKYNFVLVNKNHFLFNH